MAIYKFYQIFTSLKKVLGVERASEIFPEYATLPDKMTPQDQAKLGKVLMDRMDTLLTPQEVTQVRHKHTCNPSKEQVAEIIRIKEIEKDIDARCEAFSRFMAPSSIKRSGDIVTVSFDQEKCVCGMFRKLDHYEPTSKTWCECCNGHVIKMYSLLFDQPIASRLVEGIASGGKDCIFEIQLRSTSVR